MPKNRPWTKEELILALDLYFKIGVNDSKHPQIVELSNFLNRLADQPTSAKPGSFRNPNGVSMKLSNFGRLDRTNPGIGLTGASKLERTVWEELGNKRHETEELALQIVKSLSIKPSPQKGSPELTEGENLHKENFQLGFDPRNGIVAPVKELANSIVVTPFGVSVSLKTDGAHTSATIPLNSISGIEIREPIRSRRRFYQGISLLLGGLALGFTAWVLLELFLLVLITGGIPIVASIYILTGFAFPDSQDELILHSLGGTFRLPLETDRAKLDSHEFSRHLGELIHLNSIDRRITS